MLVLTPSGYRDVEILAVGDEVCAFDVVTGAPITNTIENIDRWEYKDGAIIGYNAVTGDEIGPQFAQWQWFSINGEFSLFGEQSIWVDGNHVTHAKHLIVGQTIHDDHNGDVVIQSIDPVDGPSIWYRFDISGDHSYIADRVTFHNASRFWVGGTGTWDLSTTTHWASGSNGSGGQSAPGSADTVTIDGSSGAGTITPSFGGSGTFQSLTCGAMGMTLEFSTNNDSITLTSSSPFSGTGTGTRTVHLGNGTWSISTTAGGATVWNFTTTTNLTFSANSSILDFTGAAAGLQTFVTGGLTYSTLKISGSRFNTGFTISGVGTIGTLNISAAATVTTGNTLVITTLSQNAQLALIVPSGGTLTITNAATITGTIANPCAILPSVNSSQATISCASGTFTGVYCAIEDTVFSGGATFTFTNSFDLGKNSGATITAPPVAQRSLVVARGTPY